MTLPPQITALLPYPEGALMNLVHGLQEQQCTVIRAIPSRAVQRVVLRALKPLLSSSQQTRLLRGASSNGEDTVLEVLPLLESARLAAFHLLPGRFAPPVLDFLKKQFDAKAAESISPSDVIIGMPGASLKTFTSHPNAIKVLHFVDAHPRAHNDHLLRYYTARQARRELYSPAYIDRVEAEIALSDHVIVPSAVVENQMLGAGVDPSRLSRIPYPTRRENFRVDGLEKRTPGRVRALYVGQISLRKGIPFLLEAAEQSPEIDFDLVGPLFPGMPVPALPSNVTYYGVLAQTELKRLMVRADVFVFPSLEDNFALALIEAASAGLPVITTPAVGAYEYVPESLLNLIDPGNAEAIVRALEAASPLSRSERVNNIGTVDGLFEAGLLPDPETYASLYLQSILPPDASSSSPADPEQQKVT